MPFPTKEEIRPVAAIRDNRLDEVEDRDVDVELTTPSAFFGSHVNLIPLQSAVQSPRLFYGARFFNQAMPLVGGEEPLVQNLDDDGVTSFDERLGSKLGAVFADGDSVVDTVDEKGITLKLADGNKRRISLVKSFPFNRKTGLTQTALVKPGDAVTAGQILAKSNFTSDRGALALGMNARVAMLPYKGWSTDDAMVVSEDFAKRLRSQHVKHFQQDKDDDTKIDRDHFQSLFSTKFTQDQLKTIESNGVVKPGTVLSYGDPIILATRPRTVNSASANLGSLSKAMKMARRDASQIWEGKEPGVVTDVVDNKGNVKVLIETERPAEVGDKLALRAGQKGVIAKIIPNDHMLRDAKGQPFDMLLNQLGIPSRVNDSTPYEILLGKVAKATGKPVKLSGFNKPGEKWYDIVQSALDAAGLTDAEDVFDPQTNQKLQNPVTTGYGYVLKLHHTADSKFSARGNASYDQNQQPLKGSSEGGASKRRGGLEVHSLMSTGAYANVREGATLTGQKNDEFWRALKAGQQTPKPGAPFVWDKFQAMLMGSGMFARNMGDGRLRLGPFTDRELEKRKATEVRSGETVDPFTLEPIKGGLFDSALTAQNSWGRIPLDFAVPNPAFESQVRHLLGLKKEELRDILARRRTL